MLSSSPGPIQSGGLSRTTRTAGNLLEEAFAAVETHVQRRYRGKAGAHGQVQGAAALTACPRGAAGHKVAREMVLRDALAQGGVSGDAAREDGEAPRPAPAGGVDIRVPIADVERILPRHWDRREEGVEGFRVELAVAAPPRAGCREPPRMPFT